MKKIALVSPYDLVHPGGVAEHIVHLRAEFEQLGHRVTLIAPRARKGGLEAGDGFYGIGRVIPIPGNGSTARVTFDVTLYAAVKAMMQRERFDVVHVHEPLMPALPYMVLLNSNAVNVGTFHAFRVSNPWYTAFKPYMSFVLSRLDARIAVSEPALEFVSQYFDGPYDIIPNGIDVARFRGAAPLPRLRGDAPRILFLGRFNEPRKGFKYLLRAMPLVHQHFPEARLIVVGAGKPERYQKLIDQHGIRNIEFVGMVPRDELPRYYASCDIFCAPSIARESFGIVLLEAMAAGKPVVASDIPGYASVMSNRREGLLVPPKEPHSLALALVRLLADPAMRRELAANGERTAERYAWSQVAAAVLAIYERAAINAVSNTRRGFG